MESLFFWIPVIFVLTFAGLAVYLWAVKSGQYDDLERDSQSIFFEEEMPPPSLRDTSPTKQERLDKEND